MGQNKNFNYDYQEIKIRRIHKASYTPYQLIEENRDIVNAWDKMLEFYGGSYVIEVMEEDIKSSRVPEDICNKLRNFAFEDRQCLEGFVPDKIIAALLGEEYKPGKRGSRLSKKLWVDNKRT